MQRAAALDSRRLARPDAHRAAVQSSLLALLPRHRRPTLRPPSNERPPGSRVTTWVRLHRLNLPQPNGVGPEATPAVVNLNGNGRNRYAGNTRRGRQNPTRRHRCSWRRRSRQRTATRRAPSPRAAAAAGASLRFAPGARESETRPVGAIDAGRTRGGGGVSDCGRTGRGGATGGALLRNTEDGGSEVESATASTNSSSANSSTGPERSSSARVFSDAALEPEASSFFFLLSRG